MSDETRFAEGHSPYLDTIAPGMHITLELERLEVIVTTSSENGDVLSA